MASDAVVDGLGGALAETIAQTPAQRAEAQFVLDILNLTNIVQNIQRIPPPQPLPPPVQRMDVIPKNANPKSPPPPAKPLSPNSKDKSKAAKCTLTARHRANGKKC
jgi:hypothetical protein